MTYWYTWPEELSLGPPDGFLSIDCVKRITIVYLLVSLYYITLGCLSHFVKRFANPDPTSSYLPIMGAKDVLFTTHVFGGHVVQLILQRPIRLLNRMLFWMCVGWIEKLWLSEKIN